MKVTVTDAGVSFAGIMKLVIVGYPIGMGIFLLPFLLLDLFGMTEVTGATVAFLVMAPLILIVQGIFVGLLINLGLFVFRRFGSIVIEYEKGE